MTGLDPAIASISGALLQARVADLLALMDAAKTAHWNVRGASFLPLHELFDEVADTARKEADKLAELARSLGVYVDGRARGSLLSAMPLLTGDTCALYAGRMTEALGIMLAALRDSAGRAMEADDLVASDALVRAAAKMQRLLYLVGSHVVVG